MNVKVRVVLSMLLLHLCAPGAEAQEANGGPWRLKVRATLSGSSDVSSDDAYTIYSGVALDVAVARELRDALAIEVSLRTESREVEGPGEGGSAAHLGSLEMLPAMLLLQWRPRGARDVAFQPYLGAGVAATLTWEKSGALDSIDVPAHLGPAVQVGFDRRLMDAAWLNLDVRWNTLRVDLSELDAGAREVKVDPLVLALGVALDF